MTKERNGTTRKWMTGIGVLVLGGGWIWNAAILSRNLSVNVEDDVVTHGKLQALGTQNREDIINMKSDIRYIKEGIDEIKKELKK